MIKKNDGFTLLELIITIAVIAIMVSFSFISTDGIKAKKSFNNSYQELLSELKLAKYEAVTKSTTVKLSIIKDVDKYTINSFASLSPTKNCSISGVWNLMKTTVINLHKNLEFTSTNLNDICFYRDNSSSGATYILAQKDGNKDIGIATIIIEEATGYADLVIEKN